MMKAFELYRGPDVTRTRIETMDSLDGLFCYGDSKGVVYVNQLELVDDKLLLQEDTDRKV